MKEEMTQINLRLSVEDKKVLEDNAKKNDMGVSEFVRKKCIEELKEHKRYVIYETGKDKYISNVVIGDNMTYETVKDIKEAMVKSSNEIGTIYNLLLAKYPEKQFKMVEFEQKQG